MLFATLPLRSTAESARLIPSVLQRRSSRKLEPPFLFYQLIRPDLITASPIDAIADGLRAPGLQERLDELEARRAQLEQDLAAGPTTPVRFHPNLAQVYRRQVERLQDALNEPEIRDEALQLLRGLLERVSIGPAENGLEVEIVGEIAKMIELGLDNTAKGATLDETMNSHLTTRPSG